MRIRGLQYYLHIQSNSQNSISKGNYCKSPIITFGTVFVSFGRYLEAEGLEKTFKFKQRNIADVVDVASAKKVIG